MSLQGEMGSMEDTKRVGFPRAPHSSARERGTFEEGVGVGVGVGRGVGVTVGVVVGVGEAELEKEGWEL